MLCHVKIVGTHAWGGLDARLHGGGRLAKAVLMIGCILPCQKLDVSLPGSLFIPFHQLMRR
jgi:hypothetical protein